MSKRTVCNWILRNGERCCEPAWAKTKLCPQHARLHDLRTMKLCLGDQVEVVAPMLCTLDEGLSIREATGRRGVITDGQPYDGFVEDEDREVWEWTISDDRGIPFAKALDDGLCRCHMPLHSHLFYAPDEIRQRYIELCYSLDRDGIFADNDRDGQEPLSREELISIWVSLRQETGE